MAGITFNDASLTISMFSDVCTRCAHLDDASLFGDPARVAAQYRKTCTAFAKGIPTEIWTGQNPHTSPYPGDGGIQFEIHPEAR